MKQLKAIIVDDEAPLREFLKRRLSVLWPELVICGEADNGVDALKLAERVKPDVAFLDIRIPGISGIDVARKLCDNCLPVLVTAYDKYALEAFEAGAIDYILKPVTDGRLEKTVERLKSRMAGPLPGQGNRDHILDKLASFARTGSEYLQWIKVRHRDSIRLISTNEIHYFKAIDKYTVVRTRDEEFLIRKTIKELVAELSPEQFWQIHRATLANVKKIQVVTRAITGSYEIHFTDIPERVEVSRSFSHMFKQM